jgi:sphingolipid 4-desaturase/C4-monooxygenase
VSFYLATGPSPLGARWIQEHFGLFGAQETNSYVGPCNRLAFNVGLHNENNDFTGVPWHRLPELRRRASEFYADQPVVRSYLALGWRFVMHPTLSIGSRMGPTQPRRLAMSLPLTLPVAPCRLSDG